jgi:hypothetical protein
VFNFRLPVSVVSDVPILDVSVIANANFACVRRNAPFPLASHLIVSNNAVRVRHTLLGECSGFAPHSLYIC